MKRVRTMAYTQTEFMRLLPHALKGYEYKVRDNVVSAGNSNYAIHIHLGPEYERRIAALAMPVMDVTIEIDGLSATETEAFLDRFDRTYRRGGG